MKPETIRRILVVGVCFLGVLMLHLWPADAQSPSGLPREPTPTRSPQVGPTPADTPTPSPSTQPSASDRSEPPADPPKTHRPWNPDERWNTRQPQPPRTSEPSDQPTDPTDPPSREPSEPPSRTPSDEPSEPSSPPPSTPPTDPPTSEPTDPPTSEPPPTTDPPTDPPTTDPPDALPPPDYELTETEDGGWVLTWSPVEGADAYYLYVKDPDGNEDLVGGEDFTYVVKPDTVSISLHAVAGTDEGRPARIEIPPPTEGDGGSGDGESGGGDSGDGHSGDGGSGDGDSGREPGDPTPTP